MAAHHRADEGTPLTDHQLQPSAGATAPSFAAPLAPIARDPHARYAWVLAVAVALAALLGEPYARQFLAQLPQQHQRATPPAVRLIGLVLQALLTYVLVRLALRLGREVGLGWPPLADWDGRSRLSSAARSALILGAQLGVIGGLLLLGLSAVAERFVSLPDLRPPAWWAATLASVSAGIAEEIWFRLVLMTALAWIGTRMLRGTVHGGTIWTANVLAALAFGAVHLPQASWLAPLGSVLVAFVLVGNGLVGLACGWLYWRRGIIAAMVCHTVVDLVIKVLALSWS